VPLAPFAHILDRRRSPWYPEAEFPFLRREK
jgi:hypothetical protein